MLRFKSQQDSLDEKMNIRLSELLGRSKILLDPYWGAVLLASLSVFLIKFSNNTLSVFLATVSTYLLFWAVRIEKEWIGVAPLPPLVAVMLGAWIHSGLGGLFLAFGSDPGVGEPNREIWEYVSGGQALWLVLQVSLVAIFSGFRPRQPVSDLPSSSRSTVPYIRKLTVLLAVFSLLWLSIGIISGTLDRSPGNYFYWVLQKWRPDSFFVMFARFRDCFFILVPIAIAKSRGKLIRFIFLAASVAYIMLSVQVGGRGIVLYPLVYLLIGCVIAVRDIRAVRIAALGLLIFMIAFIPAMKAYRDSHLITENRQSNVFQRIGRTSQSLRDGMVNWDVRTNVRELGIGLYGCSEAYLFTQENLAKPRVGFYGTNRLIFAWIPELLWKRARPIRDGHIISAEVRGLSRKDAEEKIYTSFTCISLGGDLFWRGGWLWVINGSLIVGLFFRFVSSFWYRYSGWATWHSALLTIFPATYLQMYPFGSIGETAWLWMWDLPKYLLVMLVLVLMVGRIRHIDKA